VQFGHLTILLGLTFKVFFGHLGRAFFFILLTTGGGQYQQSDYRNQFDFGGVHGTSSVVSIGEEHPAMPDAADAPW
jgi:hypothetical protein